MATRDLGITIPTIFLPEKHIDLTKWSVVACDQYTSQFEYWSEVEEIVGANPSTLHLIFPEVYLEEDGREERIDKINHAMRKHLDEGVLVEQKPGFIYVDRKTSHTQSRKGLIIAIDLETYDYHLGSQTLIRATEGTVLDRLPPRIKVRENAPIEVPHIMMLIDDPEKRVIEPLDDKIDGLEILYDFDLMMNGGHVKGYKIDDPASISGILEAFGKLAEPETFRAKYGVGSEKGILLFALGDGNHSLATAKAVWEDIKKNLTIEEINDHPARYALVEVVNVHDEGLTFEPIHRVVFNINPQQLLDKMVKYFIENNSEAYYKVFENKEDLNRAADNLRRTSNSHVIPYITSKSMGIIVVDNPSLNLEVGTLQSFLNEITKENSGIKIDYIHGEEVVRSLGIQEGNMGFYLPPMNKQDLFKTVILDGVLPRKTFSMGEAEEKRFYLECRKITKG